LCLSIPMLPSDGVYKGNMVLESEGKTVTRAFAISNLPAPPGTLILSPPVPPVHVMLPFWSSKDAQARFSVDLQEKSDKVAIDGVWVRLEQVSKSPAGFDLSNNIKFSLNDAAIDHLDVWPPLKAEDKDTRRVPAGGKLRVGVTLWGLKA